jgi:hypothetical protein
MLACRAHAGLLARDLLLLQDQGLGLCRCDWLYEIIPSANRSQASAMWERATRASRSRNSAAISRHCCARRRYSSALPTTATLAPFVRYLTNADEGNWFDQLGQNARTPLKKRTPLGSKGQNPAPGATMVGAPSGRRARVSPWTCASNQRRGRRKQIVGWLGAGRRDVVS